MAADFLEEIYQYANVIYTLEQIVAKVRKLRERDAVGEMNALLPQLYQCFQLLLDQEPQLGAGVWTSWKTALQVEHDLIRLTDIIELEVLPVLYLWMGRISAIDVEEDGYALCSSRSGFLTLQYHDHYMHSRMDPMLEADQTVEAMYDPFKKDYYIYGCGLAYHIYQIYQRLKGYGKMVLYEPDARVLEYAREYGVLSWIPQEDLEIRNFASTESFLEEAKKRDAGLFIHVPSAHAILDEQEKVRIVEKWMQQNTERYMAEDGKRNMIRNQALRLPDVSVLLAKLQCDEAVVIAAGPSVNLYWDTFRAWAGKKRIIAVGTIYKRLLEQKISPDMVVMVDPDIRVAPQIQGIEDAAAPLVLAKGAYWEVARTYRGPKYLIYSGKEADAISKEPREMWENGGTVSYTAMELAIHLNAKKIYLAGLDLGYPLGEKYAQGVTEHNEVSDSKLFYAQAVDGGTVKTDNHLNHYRKEIESLIARHKTVSFYNMSKSGALIQGTMPFEVENM